MDKTLDCVTEIRDRLVDIGDLDLRRNLKIRAFLELVLAPVFRELQPRLKYAEMGRRGITPMQYFQDFQNYPAPHGYGDRFEGRYEVRLCRSVSQDRRGASIGEARVERLILETRATLTGRPATAAPASLGFEPTLGEPTLAGTGRVLHVLTRPQNPPGHRWVTEIPEEIAFLRQHTFEDTFPTITALAELEDGYEEIRGSAVRLTGVWGVANSDVFQHIHAREYTVAMENGIAASMTQAEVPIGRYLAMRARVIFRRPSFVGQRYVLPIKLFRRDRDIVALGAFQSGNDDSVNDESRSSVFLRFEGQLC